MSAELHIASLVVHHRPDAATALDAAIAALAGVELALREGGRSVLVCEGPHQGALMQQVDALYAVPGVAAVTLVHHHAEAESSLMEEIDDGHAT